MGRYCTLCFKSIGAFGSRTTASVDGEEEKLCSECYEEWQKIDNPKVRKETKNLKTEIAEQVQTLFDNDQEKKYAKKLIGEILKEGRFFDENAVGYKAKVIKKLREIDFIHKKHRATYACDVDERFNYYIFKAIKKLLQKSIEKNKKIEDKKYGKKYICSDCTYKWISRKSFGDPAYCPSCKSKNIAGFKELQKMLESK